MMETEHIDDPHQSGSTTALPTAPEVRIEPVEVAWDFAEQLGADHPVVAELRSSQERAALLDALHHATPVAATCKPFVSAPYCRPTIHRRSIYLEMEEGGVFAFKGTEPHAPDLAEEVADLPPLAVARIDVDSYDSYRDALRALVSRVVPGGYVVIDDWHLPGCERAVKEYRREHDITVPVSFEHDLYWQMPINGEHLDGARHEAVSE